MVIREALAPTLPLQDTPRHVYLTNAVSIHTVSGKNNVQRFACSTMCSTARQPGHAGAHLGTLLEMVWPGPEKPAEQRLFLAAHLRTCHLPLPTCCRSTKQTAKIRMHQHVTMSFSTNAIVNSSTFRTIDEPAIEQVQLPAQCTFTTKRSDCQNALHQSSSSWANLSLPPTSLPVHCTVHILLDSPAQPVPQKERWMSMQTLHIAHK